MDHVFRIEEKYRSTRSYKNTEDQFARWLRGPLESGIKNTGGIRDIKSERSDDLAAIVLVSNERGVSQHDDPWEDQLDIDSGRISYWGDAKQGKPYDESGYNKKIRAAFDHAAAGQREEVPPVLVFRKPESGTVEFCGLCVPERYEVLSYQADSGTRIPNYLFHFSILNTAEIPVEWIHRRAQHGVDQDAPKVWQNWVETGTVSQWPMGIESEQNQGQLRQYEATEVAISQKFHNEIFDVYQSTCALTGIQQETLLDLAHILPRSQYPELAEHPENALVLNSLHHRAFDARLFTIDTEYRIRPNPGFEPGHPFLKETIIDNEGDKLSLPERARIRPNFLEKLNSDLAWV